MGRTSALTPRSETAEVKMNCDVQATFSRWKESGITSKGNDSRFCWPLDRKFGHCRAFISATFEWYSVTSDNHSVTGFPRQRAGYIYKIRTLTSASIHYRSRTWLSN